MRKDSSFRINLVEVIKNAEKEAVFEEIVEMVEYLVPDVSQYMRSGLNYYQRGEYDEAIKEFRKALELNPERSEIHYNLGLVLEAKGLLQEAIQEYKKALELNPEDAEAHNNLGIVYYKQGNYKKAVEEFKIALSINPDFEIAKKNLKLLGKDEYK